MNIGCKHSPKYIFMHPRNQSVKHSYSRSTKDWGWFLNSWEIWGHPWVYDFFFFGKTHGYFILDRLIILRFIGFWANIGAHLTKAPHLMEVKIQTEWCKVHHLSKITVNYFGKAWTRPRFLDLQTDDPSNTHLFLQDWSKSEITQDQTSLPR